MHHVQTWNSHFVFHFKFSAFNRALERGPWLVPQPAQLTPREAVSELFRSLQGEEEEALGSSLPERGQATYVWDMVFSLETTEAPLSLVVTSRLTKAMSWFHKEIAMPELICCWLTASHINLKHPSLCWTKPIGLGGGVLVDDIGLFCRPCDSTSPRLFLGVHSCTVARNHHSSAIETRDRG